MTELPTATQDARPLILHVRVVNGVGGGPDKTILNSPRCLMECSGFRAICAYMHPPEDAGMVEIVSRAERLGAPLIAIPDRGPLDLRVFWRMLQLCRQNDVRIWHGHDYKSNLLGLLLRPFHRMRLVSTVHGWGVLGFRNNIYNRIDRLCLPFYGRVVCVSEDLRQRCITAGVSEDRCQLIENAIDTDQFCRREAVSDAKRRLGFPAERWLVGAVGRLSDEKGFHILIQCIAQLVQRGVDVGLVIAGEGCERQRLESLIDQLDLRERVRLAGHVPDVQDLYEAMDVFVLSSFREGLPNVVLEAMAMKVPVVATRIAGVPDLIQDAVHGLLVEPNSVAELAGALERMMADEQLRMMCTQRGRSLVEQRYCFRERMARVADLYTEVLGGANGSDR